ncbi:MAG: hypothetical protein FWD60_10165 [Candidatus Azobacteroides sp.]|nr:hypothetical protein [Candidatus Azobacteroides sp.]
MKEINEQLVSTIESIIRESLNNFETQQEVNSLSDLYLYFDEENASLIAYDDIENKLLESDLDNFAEFSNQSREEEVMDAAKLAVNRLNKERFFDKEYILKPFSVNFVDSDFIVTEELLFIDDETLKLNDSLLANLDKELNDFLKELMK